MPDTFPPIWLYDLSEQPIGDLLSDGPMPIYWYRTVWQPGVAGPLLTGGFARCLACEDVAYLAQMAEVPSGRVESAAHAFTGVKWTDPAQVSAEISRAIADQESAWQQLAAALLATGALRSSEIGLTLRIQIEITDERADRSVPLPSVDPTVPFQLH